MTLFAVSACVAAAVRQQSQIVSLREAVSEQQTLFLLRQWQLERTHPVPRCETRST